MSTKKEKIVESVIRALQLVAGSTTPGESGISDDPIVKRATTAQTGVVGFETPGPGAGRIARGLVDYPYVECYSEDGIPYLVSHNLVRESLDLSDPLAKLANRYYRAIKKKLDKVTKSYWEDCCFVLAKVAEKKLGKKFDWSKDLQDLVPTDYTYNFDNDLTQDYHFSSVAFDKNDPFYSGALVGLFFHTGMDARCGFSEPIFGVQYSEGDYNIFDPLAKLFGRFENYKEISRILTYPALSSEFVDEFCDYSTYKLGEKIGSGEIEAKVSKPIGKSGYYEECKYWYKGEKKSAFPK